MVILKSYLIFIILFISIKSERWWDPVKDYNIGDDDYGYAGSSQTQCIDFYLCGSRNYTVHYLDDDKDTWSKNFSNCDPVGIGRPIDGICIYTKKSYKGRLSTANEWLSVIKGCNTSNHINGYAGKLGTPLSCIAINGKDYYRMGFIFPLEDIISSNPIYSSIRIVEALFGKGICNMTVYDKEKELDLTLNNTNINRIKFFNVTIQLLRNEEINLDGRGIKFSIYLDVEDLWLETLIHNSLEGKEISKLMVKKLKKIINFDFNEEQKKFEKKIADEIRCGTLLIHSFYKEGLIQMDIASKIMEDFMGFRGGYRLKFKLKNSDKFINLIKEIIIFISDYIKNNKRNEVLNKLNYFNDIKQLDEIIELISPYEIFFTRIIFLYIIKD